MVIIIAEFNEIYSILTLVDHLEYGQKSLKSVFVHVSEFIFKHFCLEELFHIIDKILDGSFASEGCGEPIEKYLLFSLHNLVIDHGHPEHFQQLIFESFILGVHWQILENVGQELEPLVQVIHEHHGFSRE